MAEAVLVPMFFVIFFHISLRISYGTVRTYSRFLHFVRAQERGWRGDFGRMCAGRIARSFRVSGLIKALD